MPELIPIDFTDWFLQLTTQLKKFAVLWREAPFYNVALAWREQYPQLNDALLKLTDQETQHLDDNPTALTTVLSEHIAGYEQLLPLLRVATSRSPAALNQRLNVDVPGRKWQQIEAFVGSLPGSPDPSVARVIDWCAGKAHLGRALANHWQCGLLAIERNADLCKTGIRMAQPYVSYIDYHCKDVLQQETNFTQQDFVIALHACGDLHRTLAHQWRQSDSNQLALATCCYHQWLQDSFQPLSQLGQQHNLHLTKNQAHLAVQEMVTSPQRIRRRLKQLNQWRLAFDLLQRDLRGIDEYLPTPSLPYSATSWGYEAVIKTLAERKGIHIPNDLALAPYVTRAQTHYAMIQRLQLASLGFRRALELWMVLDLVLYLQEANCKVSLTEFCDRSLTPRNLCIRAWRQ